MTFFLLAFDLLAFGLLEFSLLALGLLAFGLLAFDLLAFVVMTVDFMKNFLIILVPVSLVKVTLFVSNDICFVMFILKTFVIIKICSLNICLNDIR